MIQTKTVDITPMKITLPVIEMSQYDLGRQVIVHMKDGSDWFDLTGYTAKLQGTKPSGFGYTVDGVVDGHDITFASNYDMTSEAGFIPSEVRLTKDGVSLGSLNLILHVEETPHDVTTTDGSPETIIPEMTELVERAEAAAEVLLDCSAIATTLPAGSNATASYDVDNGVFTFGIPRGNKGETGDTGETGNGIANITKTGTSGLVDTYTISYTDGTSTTFTVTNGRNGTGSVADVWQNGVSVLDGSTAKIVADANVQSDWNESDTTDDAYIKNKPTNVSAFTNDADYVKSTDLATVATTGDYEDLLNTPTNVSVFNNDVGYIRAPETYAADANKDINDYTLTGIYRGYNPSANTPNNYNGIYVVVVYRYSADWLAQMYIDIGTCSVYTRTWKSGTTWTSWSPSNGVLVLSVASFSSLPQTISDTRITSDMVCIKAELGNPSAQTGDWTITTSNGSLTIGGSISGSTTATLYLIAAQ